MSQSNSKKNKSSRRFPLTLHPTGQFCKKIRGRLYYFGNDREEALVRYLEQAAHLYTGKGAKTADHERITLRTVCNLYLEHQQSRAEAGEITARYLTDQLPYLRRFAKYIGPNRRVSEIATIDVQNFRTKFVKEGKSPRTINNHLTAVKTMFHWAEANEVISSLPNLRAVKKLPIRKETRPTFTNEDIRKLLNHASPQIRAMIWLGLNCGFGCTDCAELRWEHVHLDNRRLVFPRPKTGVDRNFPLWPETFGALGALPKSGDRVFVTQRGNPWVRVIETRDKWGVTKRARDNAISKEFKKLMKKAGVVAEKGVGFYTLRRTAATWTARSGDPFAVQKLLGHTDLKMASTYVQDISEQVDRAINGNRRFIVPDDF